MRGLQVLTRRINICEAPGIYRFNIIQEIANTMDLSIKVTTNVRNQIIHDNFAILDLKV